MPEVATSVGILIGEATGRLRRSGIPRPRREALRIWEDLTSSALGDALLHRDRIVEGSVAERFQQAVDRRTSGEPLAHVTGYCGFRHLRLRSDRRALIPRPETEGLVDLVLARVRTGTIADVGTGTGCLALSLALEGSFEQVVGVDSSAEALDLARLNRDLVRAPVTLVQGDWCTPLRPGTLDALVSNPPYLTAGEYADLDASVRDWEPASALVSGDDGMQLTDRILSEGQAVLQPGGWLALEVDCSRAAFAALHASELGWSEVSIHMDLFGRERYLLARRNNTR